MRSSIRFRRYHVLNELNQEVGSITAAMFPLGCADNGTWTYAVGLSYCSPLDMVHYSKREGQAKAMHRLISTHPIRGRKEITFERGGLTPAIRSVIIKESERKHIPWLIALENRMQIV